MKITLDKIEFSEYKTLNNLKQEIINNSECELCNDVLCPDDCLYLTEIMYLPFIYFNVKIDGEDHTIGKILFNENGHLILDKNIRKVYESVDEIVKFIKEREGVYAI